MLALEITNKKQVQAMIKDSISKVVAQKTMENPLSEAKLIDFDLSRLLELTENKTELCAELIKDINSYFKKAKTLDHKGFLRSLKANVLGKLFYLNYKNKKYLTIEGFTSRENQGYVLSTVKAIEDSEDNAILLLDHLDRQSPMRNFFTGVTSFIYY